MIRHEAQQGFPRSAVTWLAAAMTEEVAFATSTIPFEEFELVEFEFDGACPHSMPLLEAAVPAKSGPTASHPRHHTVTSAVIVRSVRRRVEEGIRRLTVETYCDRVRRTTPHVPTPGLLAGSVQGDDGGQGTRCVA